MRPLLNASSFFLGIFNPFSNACIAGEIFYGCMSDGEGVGELKFLFFVGECHKSGDR